MEKIALGVNGDVPGHLKKEMPLSLFRSIWVKVGEPSTIHRELIYEKLYKEFRFSIKRRNIVRANKIKWKNEKNQHQNR